MQSNEIYELEVEVVVLVDEQGVERPSLLDRLHLFADLHIISSLSIVDIHALDSFLDGPYFIRELGILKRRIHRITAWHMLGSLHIVDGLHLWSRLHIFTRLHFFNAYHTIDRLRLSDSLHIRTKGLTDLRTCPQLIRTWLDFVRGRTGLSARGSSDLGSIVI